MTDDVAPIRRAFGPADLAPVLAECGVDATVTVQARADVQETRELLAVAATSDLFAGVVGWVDLTDPRVGSVIRELLKGPGGGKLVGVRHQVHDEPDAEWLLRADAQRGLGAVGDAGLAYDLLVRARELPAALEMLRRFPDMRFVIDHLAKPAIRNGDWEDWKAAMAPFGRQPNVYCKLSGLVTEADWATWRPEQLTRYIRAALGWFGPERCMFGSDWPVCLLAASYRQVVDLVRDALADAAAAAEAWVMGGTAVEFYRLAA